MQRCLSALNRHSNMKLTVTLIAAFMSKTLAILALMAASTTAQLEILNPGGSITSRVMGAKPFGAVIGLVNEAVNTAKNTIATVKKPVDQGITLIGSSQCETVKRLVGVDYDQLSSQVEPDLDQLSLNLISDEVKATFRLGSVATDLPRTAGYDFRKPLVIFMPGFGDDPTLFAFPVVNEAFQTTGNYNVLGLDASPLIRFLYLRASTLVRNIGEKLGASLASLVEAGHDPKDIYLVGYSLGSQIAGFAGKHFHNRTGHKIGRITGLDPAGPCFTHVDEDLRLKASDAEFVDVIHTNGGAFALKDAVGHMDFFPNGGEQQPNCITQLCSHLRVVELFAESVRSPDLFIAKRCASWEDFKKEQCSEDTSLMGYGSRPGVDGRYYLRTAEAPPHALGTKGLRARSEPRRGLGNLGDIAKLLI